MTQQSARSRYFARALRILGVLGAAPSLIMLAMAGSTPDMQHLAGIAAVAALAFGAMMWRTGTLIVQRVSVASEVQGDRVNEDYMLRVWSRVSSAKVFGRLSTTALALIVVPAILLFGSAMILLSGILILLLFDPHFDNKDKVALPLAALPLIIIASYLLGSRLGIWAARQADLAKLDSQIIRRAAAAHERQGGALSLDVQRGEHGGLTEIDAVTGGLGALSDHDGDVDVDEGDVARGEAAQHAHAAALHPAQGMQT